MKRLRVVPVSSAIDGDGAAHAERRSAERRCADLGADAAMARAGWLMAVLALWLASRPGTASVTPLTQWLGLTLLVAWLGLTLAWWPLRARMPAFARHRRGAWRVWSGVAHLNLALPCLLPWLAVGHRPRASAPAWTAGFDAVAAFDGFPVWPLVMAAGAIAALPMLPGLAKLASLGVLSAAAAGVAQGQYPAGLLMPLLAAGGGWLAATLADRRWRADVRLRIDAVDRLRLVTAERDAAQRADEDKRRFVAAASHDLRQPMHALGLFAATLERHLQGSADEPLARNMIRSVEALDRSFSALLDLSRLEAGTVQPHVQRFPLRDVFRRLHMHFAGQAEEAGLGLRFSAGGKAVNSDPQLLERVLANLIQNALRYTRTGGVAVVARTGAHQLKLEVWDSGCGIAEADLPRVFDEFYRIPGPARDDTQGLGMGLAIVKRLVALLGHTLDVASMPGRGTMFRIGIATGPMAEVEDATAAADTIPAPFLEARSVLLIDDESQIREGLHMLLTEWGFEPVAVADLAGARQAAEALGDRLDLVISDLHLAHGEDGLAVIQSVRAVCGRAVPAILVTGDTTPAEIRRASASGHMVLFKPVQPSKLFSVLRSLM